MDDKFAYQHALAEEKLARENAEALLEKRTRELFLTNQKLQNRYQEAQDHVKELEVLFSLSKLSEEGFNTNSALQFFINAICRLKKIAFATVYKIDRENGYKRLCPSEIEFSNSLQSHQVLREYLKERCFMVGQDFVGQIYKNNEPVWIEDVRLIENFSYREACEAAGLFSVFAMPLMRYPRVIGVGLFFSETPMPLDKQRLDFVKTAANQLSILLERRHNEIKFRKNFSKLKKVHQELKTTQVQLLEHSKLVSIGQLAAGVAHEINNPIAFVASNTEVLIGYFNSLKEIFKQAEKSIDGMEEGSHAKTEWQKLCQVKNLKYIWEDAGLLLSESQEGLARVKEIVADLKTFSHAEKAEVEEADIHQCIDVTLKMIWHELKYNCTVHKEYGEIPILKCYPRQLNQVFLNLLVNAAHAIPEKGDIYIRTAVEGDDIVVAITDTGTGIPKENMEKLYDPFFTTKPVGQGTGLGLSISYNIIQKHHGKILVDSVMGKGTTFKICLPREGVGTDR